MKGAPEVVKQLLGEWGAGENHLVPALSRTSSSSQLSGRGKQEISPARSLPALTNIPP